MFTRKSSLKRHARLHDPSVERFICPKCHKDFANKSNVKIHWDNAHIGRMPVVLRAASYESMCKFSKQWFKENILLIKFCFRCEVPFRMNSVTVPAAHWVKDFVKNGNQPDSDISDIESNIEPSPTLDNAMTSDARAEIIQFDGSLENNKISTLMLDQNVDSCVISSPKISMLASSDGELPPENLVMNLSKIMVKKILCSVRLEHVFLFTGTEYKFALFTDFKTEFKIFIYIDIE